MVGFDAKNWCCTYNLPIQNWKRGCTNRQQHKTKLESHRLEKRLDLPMPLVWEEQPLLCHPVSCPTAGKARWAPFRETWTTAEQCTSEEKPEMRRPQQSDIEPFLETAVYYMSKDSDCISGGLYYAKP